MRKINIKLILVDLVIKLIISSLVILFCWTLYYFGSLFLDGKLDTYLINNEIEKTTGSLASKSGKISLYLYFLKYFKYILFCLVYFISFLIAIVAIYLNLIIWFKPVGQKYIRIFDGEDK
jgi:hypothetical protein